MNRAIELTGVSAGYREIPVLQQIGFDVAEGEIVGILGPNGAGKSTLFRVLSGLLPVREGSVRLFGSELRRLSPGARARTVAVVPQDLDIPVPYTVEEVVMMGRTVSIGRLARPAARDRQAVERALVYTDVADIRDRPLNELSGGERQRAIVAMALAQEPRLILMDEATSHLDINHRLEIMQLVERLNAESGLTVLMISHDLQLAAEFSRRLIMLDHGAVVSDGPPAEVLTEENIRRVYHCDVRVCQDPQTGGLSVLAAPRLPAGTTGKGVRIHVIAGGGCGEEVLRRLSLSGFAVSCGVLNRGDLDTAVADAIGAATALEQPFSPVGPAALAAGRELALAADAVVLTSVPFGPGNLPNLRLLEEAQAAGKPVYVMDGIEQRDYTPGREAVARLRALRANGAIAWRDVAELTALLAAVRLRA